MGRFLAGSIAALMLVAAGLFWWEGRVSDRRVPLVAQSSAGAGVATVPPEGDPNARGAPPPALPPQADQRTREERRFDRYDRNRDKTITRAEMMASRTAAFRKLDKDGNNLLSFEEWAVKTSDRFAGADSNRDGKLTAAEFATTAPKRNPAKATVCACDED